MSRMLRYQITREENDHYLIWRIDKDIFFWCPKRMWEDVERVKTPLLKAVLLDWIEKELRR